MTKRQAALDKFFDDLWRLGCFVLTFVIVGIFVGCAFRLLQNLPPMPEHPTAYVGTQAD